MKLSRRRRVEDFMTTAVIPMRESDPIRRVAQEMTVAAIRHIPVVDAHQRVVGIVSTHDLMHALTVEHDLTAGQIMTRSVRTVSPSTPAHVAVRLMIDDKINSLPVISDETQELVGIVTTTDFLLVAEAVLGRASAGAYATA